MLTIISCRTLLINIMTLTLGTIAWGAHLTASTKHQKNLNPAVRTAKRPENHAAAAAYYNAEADRLDAEAAAYEKTAAAYRNGPYIKNLMAPNTAARYDYMAKGLREEAQSYRERAALHELMTRKVRVGLLQGPIATTLR
jgi:hypothetical protein